MAKQLPSGKWVNSHGPTLITIRIGKDEGTRVTGMPINWMGDRKVEVETASGTRVVGRWVT